MSAFFYQYQTGGDVLFYVIDPSAYPDRQEKKGDVVALYKQDELVGINFLDFGKRVKIHAKGLIPDPNKEFIDIVNAELTNAGLKPIDYVTDSGFKIGTVIFEEEHPLDERAKIIEVSLGDKKVATVTRYQNVAVGVKIVVAIDKTIRFDGTRFEASLVKNIPVEAEVCSAFDLRLGEDRTTAFVPKEGQEGADFFCE